MAEFTPKTHFPMARLIYIALDNMLKFHHYRINVIVFLSANNCCTTQLKHCKEMIPLGKNRLCYPEELGNRNHKAALLMSINLNGILIICMYHVMVKVDINLLTDNVR